MLLRSIRKRYHGETSQWTRLRVRLIRCVSGTRCLVHYNAGTRCLVHYKKTSSRTETLSCCRPQMIFG